MIAKLALAVIAVALVLAVMGRLSRPKVGKRKDARRVESARKCPACGAWVLDGQECSCGGRA